MTADTRSPLVPKLRFPEFAQGPGWDHAKVADLVETVTPPKKLTTSTYLADGRFPVIDQSQNCICGWTNDDKAIITRPLPVIVFGDHTCVLKFVNRPFAQGADGIKILRARGRVSTVYLYHQLTHRPVVMEEYKRHFSTLKDKVVCFPDAKTGEQQKIADCLGSLDDLIAAEGRKLEALRRHKQGLMQQLFPQEGETVPRLGRKSDWKAFELSELAFFQEGPGIMAADFCTEGVPLVRLSGLSGEIVTLDGCNYLDPDRVNNKWKHFQLVAGDLLISTSASFGLVSIVTENAAGAIFYTGIVRLRSVDERMNNDYLKAYLESPGFLRQAAAHAVGGGIKHFGPTHLRQMQIQTPPLSDQQWIAACLSTVDGCIAGQSRKLETLHRHKQSLLQLLFPSLEGR